MEYKDFDINIALLKQKIDRVTNVEQDQQRREYFDKQINNLTDKISRFTFEIKTFCNGLFSMLMPSELFEEPMIVDNIVLFQSQIEKIVLVLKVIESDQDIDFEKIQTDYINQMRQSKQQTMIDIADLKQVEFGTIYYFSAIHSMPGGALCDFIILFKIHDKMIFMDFNFDQKDYFFWKPILCNLSGTIRIEGELDI